MKFLTVIVAAAVGLGGCQGGTSRSAPAPVAAPTATPKSAVDYDAIFKARSDSARLRFTAADARFMTGMIGHHAQALVMAAMAPTHDAGPSLRVLAARITNAQRDEIVLMQAWLRERGQPVPSVPGINAPLAAAGSAATPDHDMSAMDHDHAMSDGSPAAMPGMLTPAQLSQLDAARGAAFGRLFLTFMIQHHRGAVVMVNSLFRTDGAGQDEIVFKFASDVQVDQSTEIARMERMLTAASAASSSP